MSEKLSIQGFLAAECTVCGSSGENEVPATMALENVEGLALFRAVIRPVDDENIPQAHCHMLAPLVHSLEEAVKEASFASVFYSTP